MSKNKPYIQQHAPPQSPQGQQQARVATAQVVQFEGQIHTGPIPSPDIIAGYETVLPGAADRIIKMAENEQKHRHNSETRNQRYRGFLALTGQIFALIIGLSGIGGGVYLVSHDKSLVGFGVFFSSLAALVGVFLYQRKTTPTPAKQPVKKQPAS